MSFNVTLYQFSKRANSTLQPVNLTGVELACDLKQPTSYKNPVFTFFVEDAFPWNYLQWDNWYYFITDVISVRNDLWEVHCKLDVLATYKTEIGQTSAFVLYDTAPNSELVDSRLSQITSATTNTNFDTLDFGLGAFVMLGIVGQSSVNLWGVDAGTASTLLNEINNWMDRTNLLPIPDPPEISGFDDVVEAMESLIETMGVVAHNLTTGVRTLISTGRAPDCIKSALLLPLPVSAFPGSSSKIYLGEYPTNKSGVKISQTARISRNVHIAIPWQASDWRRNDAYTKIYVSLPYIGTVSYPASQLMGADSLGIEYQVTVNGAIVAEVSANGQRIGRYSGNCASNYMVGASNINPLSGMAGLLGGAASAAGVALASNPAGMVGATAAGIMGAINGAQYLPTCVGGAGGGAWTDSWTATVTVVYHNTNVDPSSVSGAIGTPAMAVKTIGTLSGFVQTRAASVNASCYEDVRREINGLMDGGFFYE